MSDKSLNSITSAVDTFKMTAYIALERDLLNLADT